VTFSGLLNAIDGVAANEGRLLFMTTNHKERLAAALVRPGRVDMMLLFDLVSPDQVKRLFRVFYGADDDNVTCCAEKFASRVAPNCFSAATLQDHFLKFKDKPQEALDNFNDIVKDDKEATDSVGEKENLKKKKNDEDEDGGSSHKRTKGAKKIKRKGQQSKIRSRHVGRVVEID